MAAVTYQDLRGKSIIVTGGASNLGRGMTLAFAQQGARIVLADVDVEQSNATAELARAEGAEVVVVNGDLSSADVVNQVVAAAQDTFGCIDVLVNNVGWLRTAWFVEVDDETIDRLLRVNLGATIAMTKAVLPSMVEQRAGNVVSMASDAAYGDARMAVYGATKAAIISLSKSLAKEYGRYGIRFNVVAPGLVEPPGQDWVGSSSLWSASTPVLDQRSVEAIKKAVPLRRLSEPSDVAAAALFFASESAGRQLTGQVLSVSGGYVMPG